MTEFHANDTTIAELVEKRDIIEYCAFKYCNRIKLDERWTGNYNRGLLFRINEVPGWKRITKDGKEYNAYRMLRPGCCDEHIDEMFNRYDAR